MVLILRIIMWGMISIDREDCMSMKIAKRIKTSTSMNPYFVDLTERHFVELLDRNTVKNVKQQISVFL